MNPSIFAFAFLVVFLLATAAVAQPKPGDVYREYKWSPGRWQRVTGPDATDRRAKAFLPNAVNHVRIDDFKHAIRAEMSLEVINVHPGTKGHKVRLNGGKWLKIPFSPNVPGRLGRPPALEYHTMQYPVVPVSLDALKKGDNTFEFTAQRGTSFGGVWPQWLSYGASVRIYYDEAAKDHPTGRITSHSEGAKVGESEVFRATTSSTKPIKQVEFVGKYTDFNWEGDGNYRQWQDQTSYANIRNHIGTDTRAPFKVTWDNDWIPDQDEPMEVSARIVDKTGLTYITPSVTGLKLDRPYSVEMYTPHGVPKKWGTRAGRTDSARINVQDDLVNASAAQITLATWNGVAADEIGLNGKFVRRNIGRDHNLSYNSFKVPVDFVRQGVNTFHTFSDTKDHGIDVQWPGPVLFVRHEIVPEPSTLTLLGLGLFHLLGRRRSCSTSICRKNLSFPILTHSPER